MRNTGPVTQREVRFDQDQELVTSTTAKGVITFSNDTFCKIAGYSREQLIGQAHNIVRHPDMPQKVFGLMWASLQGGRHWMGIVKNRCANGDHYWVDAYVTPLVEQGRISGFESVRTAPTREQIQRATEVYKRIKSGRPPIALGKRILARYWLPISAFVISMVFFLLGSVFSHSWNTGHLLWSVISSAAISAGICLLQRQQLATALAESLKIIDDPLAAYVYTGRCDSQGAIQLAQLTMRSRIRTGLGRFAESARDLQSKSREATAQANNTLARMSHQQNESEQMASAMEQMANAAQEVATGISQTSDAAGTTLSEVKSGEQVIQLANREIKDLSDTVDNLAEVLDGLAAGSTQISGVIDVIRGVADQTNLLALNAAIEAARAGEQGRGFSVVADEVRTLAQRTQDSTASIHALIDGISKSIALAVEQMNSCRNASHRSVENVAKVNTVLATITESTSNIEALAHKIAAAAEQQSQVTKEVHTNTRNIINIAHNTESEAKTSAQLSAQLEGLAETQFQLIERFKG